MKRTGIILSTLLILVGFTGFIGGALVSEGVINYNKEVPLGDIKGIVVDNKENIYIGLGFYGKVQVYNNKGEFVVNWKVSSGGGTFNMGLTDDQNILISTARGDKQIIYDQNGKVICSETIDNIYSLTKTSWNTYTTLHGKKYEIKGGMFPRIDITNPDNKNIISQGFLLHTMKGPFPAWLILAFGLVIRMLTQKLKTRKINGAR